MGSTELRKRFAAEFRHRFRLAPYERVALRAVEYVMRTLLGESYPPPGLRDNDYLLLAGTRMYISFVQYYINYINIIICMYRSYVWLAELSCARARVS